MSDAEIGHEPSPRRWGIYLPWLAVVTVVLITAASFWWSSKHPYGFNWDESLYINEVHTDVKCFHDAGVRGLVKSWVTLDVARPPAYRVLAFPFAALFGQSAFVLRGVAILFRVLTFWLVFIGVASIAGRRIGALAVILLALCPDIVFFGTVFYNEYALYLATAGTCCFVFRNWGQAKINPVNCAALGLSLGVGALAKTSFPAVAGCFLLLVAVLALRKKIAGPGLGFLLGASVIGTIIAGPWWLWNYRTAIGFARFAVSSARVSFGSPGLETIARYLGQFIQEGFGLPLGCCCIAVVLLALFKRVRAGRKSSNVMQLAMVCALCAPIPVCLLPLGLPNQVIYHVSQTLVLFAAGFALLAGIQGWMTIPSRFLVLNIAVFVQLALILTPLALPASSQGNRTAWTALARREQWNWNKLRTLLRSKGLECPSIAYLGGSSPFNPPAIDYPWLLRNEREPRVTWLWRQEDGPTNVDSLISAATTYDVVLASPDIAIHGSSDFKPDNAYNGRFIERMRKARQFLPPLHLHLGRLNPVELLVFLKSSSTKQ